MGNSIKDNCLLVSRGTLRLLDKFAAAAGCANRAQALDAVFNISSTVISDSRLGVQYGSGENDVIAKSFFSPQMTRLSGQKKSESLDMNISHWVQIGHLSAHADKQTGLAFETFSMVFDLAVLMALDMHEKYNCDGGRALRIPVGHRQGNPLFERHILLRP